MKMRAIETFVLGTADGERMIHGGMVFDSNDVVVKSCPDLFAPVPENEAPQPPAPRRRRA